MGINPNARQPKESFKAYRKRLAERVEWPNRVRMFHDSSRYGTYRVSSGARK
jgi:hypothetical protein